MSTNTNNPWLGLDSYPEGRKIYGRDKEIAELSQRILYNTQTVIYGKSGIGKSSILNAGVFPILRRHNYFPVYVRLVHDDQVSYCSQIISAVNESVRNLRIEDLSAPDDSMYKTVEGYANEVVTRYDNDTPEGLWEYFHRHEFCYEFGDGREIQNIFPVLIFDQFEEIFTLQKDNDKVVEFFDELASLLNNICPQYLLQNTVEVSDRQLNTTPNSSLIKRGLIRRTTRLDYIDETNMRMVISLREDYLSYLERNITHIPSLKHNRYCLRPLSDDQAGDIIMKPVPGLIDVHVAKSIICKVTGASPEEFEVGDDKSQLEVDSAMLSLFLTELFEKKPLDETHLTMEMVNSLGKNIISDFYKKVTSQIPEEIVHFLEDRLLTEGGRRDNIPLSSALKTIPKDILKYLKKEHLIHVFPWNDEMRVEYMHDILCDTVMKNRSARLERLSMEEKRREFKHARRKRIMTYSVCVLVGLITSYYFCYVHPITERYASTTKVFGRFKGVEKLTKKEARYRPYHFIFRKKGLATKIYSSLECRNGFDTLSTLHSIRPYVLGDVYDDVVSSDASAVLGKACQWEFIKDAKGKEVVQERAYDDKKNLLYAINYYKTTIQAYSRKGRYHQAAAIGSFVDDQGLPMKLLEDGYRFVRITYDNAGHDMLVEYFDIDGTPSTNADGAYQTYYEYNDDGLMLSISSLNKYGKRMIDRAGNCGMVLTYDGYRLVETLSVDEFGREKTVDDGYSKVKYEYDEHGREIEVSVWSMDEPVSSDSTFHRKVTIYEDNSTTLLAYDAEDNLLYREYVMLNEKGQVLTHEYGNENEYTLDITGYDENGRLIYNLETNLKGSDTLGVYKFERNGNTEMRRFEGPKYVNYINYTTYDEKGRVLDDAYYEMDGVTPYEDDYRFHKVTHAYSDNGMKRFSIWREEVDTTVYYDRSGINHIVVNQNYPVRNSSNTEVFNADTILIERQTQIYDVYGNNIEEVQGAYKVYKFINARTHEPTREAVGFLTSYGFPSEDFNYYTYVNDEWEKQVCDENAELFVDEDYLLPKVYNSARDQKAVFIEIIENGRKFFGVLLESDSGVCYGEENYDFESFSQFDDVIYLNLTTMRVDEIKLSSDDIFWTIYNRNITEEEYQIYLEHYRGYKSRGLYYVVYGTIEGEEGFMVENGYTGDYLILRWCDWDCTQSIERFVKEFEEESDNPKDVILLPFEDVDGDNVFGDIITLDDIDGLLGLRLHSSMISEDYFNTRILFRYMEFIRETEIK